jgi:Predicted epimerase, PhzC/PhzF homolog
VNLERYSEFIQTTIAKEIFIFCPETHYLENHLCARMFAPALGITEDPATGSANGCLAGYLSNYAYFGSDQVNIRVEQGYEIDRPSLLLLKSAKNRRFNSSRSWGKCDQSCRRNFGLMLIK